MKKIVPFLIVLVAAATASASLYNTELLADSSFEASEGLWGNYYWGEDGNTDTFVSNDNTTNYFESGTQVNDGLFSIKISYGAGATPTYTEDGFAVDKTRNSNNDFTSNQGVSFTKVDINNLSYLAGDTLEASLKVYIDQWDANSNGVGFRVVANEGSGEYVLGTSSFTTTTGSWQTVDLSHEFTNAFTGSLKYEVRYHFDNSGAGTASTAWIDSASMKVIPEPSTLMTVVLGAMILFRLVKSRPKD